jgi:hypothetical protein
MQRKIVRLRLLLDEKGIDESNAKEIIEKLVSSANDKDLTKIKEWHEEHTRSREGQAHDHQEEG